MVSFLDLLELRFVKAFRRQGVSMQAIRRAAENASEMLGADHPFSCKRFQTDGRSIFASLARETGETALVDMVKRQDVFQQVVGPSLYRGIEYSKDGGALRWLPDAGNRKVVLDPEVRFGAPVVVGTGVPTVAIAAAYRAEGQSVARVAKLYELTHAQVKAAVEFESSLAQAA